MRSRVDDLLVAFFCSFLWAPLAWGLAVGTMGEAGVERVLKGHFSWLFGACVFVHFAIGQWKDWRKAQNFGKDF